MLSTLQTAEARERYNTVSLPSSHHHLKRVGWSPSPKGLLVFLAENIFKCLSGPQGIFSRDVQMRHKTHAARPNR